MLGSPPPRYDVDEETPAPTRRQRVDQPQHNNRPLLASVLGLIALGLIFLLTTVVLDAANRRGIGLAMVTFEYALALLVTVVVALLVLVLFLTVQLQTMHSRVHDLSVLVTRDDQNRVTRQDLETADTQLLAEVDNRIREHAGDTDAHQPGAVPPPTGRPPLRAQVEP